jgi:hypothetical protein
VLASSAEIYISGLRLVNTRFGSFEYASPHQGVLLFRPENISCWRLSEPRVVSRSGTDHPTQEFLSHLLGVRRATVNVATGTLKKAGFIRSVRGNVTVIDRGGLESAACDCYREILKVYDSVLPPGSKREI